MSQKIKELLDASMLPMLTHKLFMHYHDHRSKMNYDDPMWQNQGLFFWTAEEPFERKSLPRDFKRFERRFFIIGDLPAKFDLVSGKVAPWFGMPGDGDKFFIESRGQRVPIHLLAEKQIIQYVELIQLTEDNSVILSDKSKHRILLDSKRITYHPETDTFSNTDNKEISLSEAFDQGAIKIIKVKR